MIPGPILYVEDEETDILLVQRVCTRIRLKNPLKILKDGREAIRYLQGDELPALVLLDLNLPFKSGFEVLHWIRQQPKLEGLNVLVFTSSNQVSDIERARALGATDYLVKPSSFGKLIELLTLVNSRWLDTALGQTP